MTKNELILDIKELIINSLDLEDMTIEDIGTETPLFGEGLALDSIDALELGMALKKKYDLTFKADKKANKEYFYSVATLADFIIANKNIQVD